MHLQAFPKPNRTRFHGAESDPNPNLTRRNRSESEPGPAKPIRIRTLEGRNRSESEPWRGETDPNPNSGKAFRTRGLLGRPGAIKKNWPLGDGTGQKLLQVAHITTPRGTQDHAEALQGPMGSCLGTPGMSLSCLVVAIGNGPIHAGCFGLLLSIAYR